MNVLVNPLLWVLAIGLVVSIITFVSSKAKNRKAIRDCSVFTTMLSNTDISISKVVDNFKTFPDHNFTNLVNEEDFK